MASSAFTESRIDTEHTDQILDVSFNFYGTRMATSSNDENIKVWDLDEKKQWKCTASWKSPESPAWRVSWGHPEFGQLLVTCSFDRTVTVWQESVGYSVLSDGVKHAWVHKAHLVDSTSSVKDVKFAPHHLGLQLASCSAKGIVYIYEAPNIMSLKHWTMRHQINCDMPCSCLSWSTNKSHNPMLAVGSDDSMCPSGGKVVIYEYNESSHDWVIIHMIMQLTDPVNDLQFAPNGGLDYNVLAIASNDLYIYHLKTIEEDANNDQIAVNSTLNINQVAQFDDHNCNVLRVTWNDFGNLLVSNGDDGQILLWMENYMQIWKSISSLKQNASGYCLQGFNGVSINDNNSLYY